MHFTEPVYRNPYWPTWPLLEVTAGCTHNRCKFCTMYKGVRFDVRPLDDIEANRGEFDPLSEGEMLEEVLLFVENLKCDCAFITHHTIGGANLTSPDFIGRKDAIVAVLRDQIENGDLNRMARVRAMKRSL